MLSSAVVIGTLRVNIRNTTKLYIYKLMAITCQIIARGADTLGRFSAIFTKGDKFCDFLFAFPF